MRTATAVAMTLLLLGVVAACPLVACPAKAKSCQHKSQSHGVPCPQSTTVQDCPYQMLEKVKTVAFTAQTMSPVAAPVLPLRPTIQRVQFDSQLSDSAGLFLRIRVLRI